MEGRFALRTDKQLRQGMRQGIRELETTIYRHLDVSRNDPRPFVGTKTADETPANVLEMQDTRMPRLDHSMRNLPLCCGIVMPIRDSAWPSGTRL